jgi:hypothetical protein
MYFIFWSAGDVCGDVSMGQTEPCPGVLAPFVKALEPHVLWLQCSTVAKYSSLKAVPR